MSDKFNQLYLGLHTLTVFRNLYDSPVFNSFLALSKTIAERKLSEALREYSNIACLLLKDGSKDIGGHLFELLKYDENVFSREAEAGGCKSDVKAAAERDIKILSGITALSCRDIKNELKQLAKGQDSYIIDSLPEWKTDFALEPGELSAFISKNGSGLFAKHRAFSFKNGRLEPILYPDPIRYDDMIGYTWQREAVIENTRALLSGKSVNNVLLYGDSGTGKSAAVKALLSVEGFDALRIIEADKAALTDIPALLRDIALRPLKFILFIDDLSFEDGDRNYSALKVILEGSFEARPKNTALYVTSNRRQLIKRRFSDSDEINEKETVQEKTSLADRFGLRIPFQALNLNEYLDMAEKLARNAGSHMESGELRRRAAIWELEHSSKTPRTARQFADYIAAHTNSD